MSRQLKQCVLGIIDTVKLIEAKLGLGSVEIATEQEDEAMGIVEALGKAGFKPEANVDEQFPPFSGEYRFAVRALRPYLDLAGTKTAYMMDKEIIEVISGDKCVGRRHTSWYRIAGTDFNKQPLTQEAIGDAVKAMLNDLFTMGVELDTASDESMEATFGRAIDKEGYMRAYHFPSPNDADRRVQRVVIKQQKHLRKDKKGAAKSTTPF